MNLDLLTSKLREFNFQPTPRPLTLPIVIHGVPGCGKSTLLRQLLSEPDFVARTLGAPYGDSLTSEGVKRYDPNEILRARHRALDEYQLASPEITATFTILLGDPYQGPYRREPHFFKATSHRVPRPVCQWLQTLGFQISSDVSGSCALCHPYKLPPNHSAIRARVIHLGPASLALARSHQLLTSCPQEVQGSEFQEVTILAHSSELQLHRTQLYVAATRAQKTLTVLSDAFHELRAAP